MQSNEQIISDFLRTAYTDERLVALLAHAEDGKLSWHSCCCFLGVPTADHALRGEMMNSLLVDHLKKARRLFGRRADDAFMNLSDSPFTKEADAQRRVKLIPLIKQEMDRREAERSSSSPAPEYVSAV